MNRIENDYIVKLIILEHKIRSNSTKIVGLKKSNEINKKKEIVRYEAFYNIKFICSIYMQNRELNAKTIEK